MNADIRLLKLCRRAMNSGDIPNSIMNSDGMSIMATDYFDVIEVQSFSSRDSLAKVMGVGSDSLINENDVSVQSFSLYCEDRTLKKYASKEKYEDPFLDSTHSAMPFLSIIQVHITPEVLARMNIDPYKEDMLALIQKYEDDLHDLMDSFVTKFKNISFVYRIYHALSAGDFSVVIRSERADTSFLVSTLLRRRTASSIDGKGFPLVLYKTYTILSIYNTVIQENNPEESSGNDNVFVIRCCFSNKYWSEKSEIDRQFQKNKEELSKIIYNLNGRYDFSVQISEAEFKSIYELLFQYKQKKGVSSKTTEGSEGQKSLIVTYLEYLINHGYLSYVNERYLFKIDKNEELADLNEISRYIEVRSFREKEVFLNNRNEEIYRRVLNLYDRVRGKVEEINGFRKNIKYHMDLLHRLIVLCQTINGLSDTRIYAAILLHQLEVVLDSVERYLKIMEERQDIGLLGKVEIYLRESVFTLDCYAQYVRNNNLQSLQTPNYGLESNSSLEKFLVGYSWFLEELIQWYEKSKLSKEIEGTTREFLPVLIPQLTNASLSIEVMFPEPYDETEKDWVHLMVIKSSTLRELTEVPLLQASFLHEIAHQFRYEERKERNGVLLQYCIKKAFSALTETIWNTLSREIKGFRLDNQMYDLLEELISESYIEAFYGESHLPYPVSSLIELKGAIEEDIEFFFTGEKRWDKIAESRKALLEEIKFDIPVNDPVCCLAVEKICNLEKDLVEYYRSKDEEYIKKSICIAANAARELVERVIDPGFGEKKVYNKEEKIKEWAGIIIDEWEDTKLSNHEELEKRLRYFAVIMQRLLLSPDFMQKDWEYKKKKEQFWETLYQKLCEEWSRKDGSCKAIREETYGRHMARYLGIDFQSEECRKIFTEFMKLQIQGQDVYKASDLMDMAVMTYRETTSDMFMCRMLQLEPFGYLNVMAYQIPIDVTVDEAYVERFVNVLYALKGDLGDEAGGNSVCKGIYFKIKECLWRILQSQTRIYDFVKGNLDKEMQSMVEYCMKTEKADSADALYNQCTELKGRIAQLRTNFRDYWEDRDDFYYSFLNGMMHYENLCKILISIIQYASMYLKELERYPFVKKDLQKGAAILEKLSEDFEHTSFWKYCSNASRVLNAPYICYESTEVDKINDSMINFIRDMYYQHKVKSAIQIIGEEEVKKGED